MQRKDNLFTNGNHSARSIKERKITMAYEKRTWECGDILTPEAMNHIEDGIQEVSDAQEQGGGGSSVSSLVKTIENTATNVEIEGQGNFESRIAFSQLTGKTVLGVTKILTTSSSVDVTGFVWFSDNSVPTLLVRLHNRNSTVATVTVNGSVTYLDE